MKLTFEQALEFAKLGYKPDDIKALINMEDTPDDKPEDKPEEKSEDKADDKPEDKAEDKPDDKTEDRKKIAELEAQIKKMQDEAISRDLQKNKDIKSNEEMLADIFRDMM